MKNIGLIKNKINEIESEKTRAIDDLKSKLIEALKFDKNKTLKAAVIDLDLSKKLIIIEYGDFYMWTEIDVKNIINDKCDLEKEALSNYLSELGIFIDYKYSTISQSIGPCILINYEGDVFDQETNRWIIENDQYQNDTELKELINQYMDKQGYYPSIVKQDRYGDAFFVEGI